MSEGIMIILSSPSGAGKTTLVKLLSKRKGFVTSISHTTRTPRSNEVDGKDYHFISNERFEKMIDNKEFLEFAKVFKNFYGTTKSNIFDELRKELGIKKSSENLEKKIENEDHKDFRYNNLSTAPTGVFWHRGIDDRRIINPKFFLEEHEWDQGHKETIYIELIHDLF